MLSEVIDLTDDNPPINSSCIDEISVARRAVSQVPNSTDVRPIALVPNHHFDLTGDSSFDEDEDIVSSNAISSTARNKHLKDDFIGLLNDEDKQACSHLNKTDTNKRQTSDTEYSDVEIYCVDSDDVDDANIVSNGQDGRNLTNTYDQSSKPSTLMRKDDIDTRVQAIESNKLTSNPKNLSKKPDDIATEPYYLATKTVDLATKPNDPATKPNNLATLLNNVASNQNCRAQKPKVPPKKPSYIATNSNGLATGPNDPENDQPRKPLKRPVGRPRKIKGNDVKAIQGSGTNKCRTADTKYSDVKINCAGSDDVVNTIIASNSQDGGSVPKVCDQSLETSKSVDQVSKPNSPATRTNNPATRPNNPRKIKVTVCKKYQATESEDPTSKQRNQSQKPEDVAKKPNDPVTKPDNPTTIQHNVALKPKGEKPKDLITKPHNLATGPNDPENNQPIKPLKRPAGRPRKIKGNDVNAIQGSGTNKCRTADTKYSDVKIYCAGSNDVVDTIIASCSQDGENVTNSCDLSSDPSTSVRKITVDEKYQATKSNEPTSKQRNRAQKANDGATKLNDPENDQPIKQLKRRVGRPRNIQINEAQASTDPGRPYKSSVEFGRNTSHQNLKSRELLVLATKILQKYNDNPTVEKPDGQSRKISSSISSSSSLSSVLDEDNVRLKRKRKSLDSRGTLSAKKIPLSDECVEVKLIKRPVGRPKKVTATDTHVTRKRKWSQGNTESSLPKKKKRLNDIKREIDDSRSLKSSVDDTNLKQIKGVRPSKVVKNLLLKKGKCKEREKVNKKVSEYKKKQAKKLVDKNKKDKLIKSKAISKKGRKAKLPKAKKKAHQSQSASKTIKYMINKLPRVNTDECLQGLTKSANNSKLFTKSGRPDLRLKCHREKNKISAKGTPELMLPCIPKDLLYFTKGGSIDLRYKANRDVLKSKNRFLFVSNDNQNKNMRRSSKKIKKHAQKLKVKQKSQKKSKSKIYGVVSRRSPVPAMRRGRGLDYDSDLATDSNDDVDDSFKLYPDPQAGYPTLELDRALAVGNDGIDSCKYPAISNSGKASIRPLFGILKEEIIPPQNQCCSDSFSENENLPVRFANEGSTSCMSDDFQSGPSLCEEAEDSSCRSNTFDHNFPQKLPIFPPNPSKEPVSVFYYVHKTILTCDHTHPCCRKFAVKKMDQSTQCESEVNPPSIQSLVVPQRENKGNGKLSEKNYKLPCSLQHEIQTERQVMFPQERCKSFVSSSLEESSSEDQVVEDCSGKYPVIVQMNPDFPETYIVRRKTPKSLSKMAKVAERDKLSPNLASRSGSDLSSDRIINEVNESNLNSTPGLLHSENTVKVISYSPEMNSSGFRIKPKSMAGNNCLVTVTDLPDGITIKQEMEWEAEAESSVLLSTDVPVVDNNDIVNRPSAADVSVVNDVFTDQDNNYSRMDDCDFLELESCSAIPSAIKLSTNNASTLNTVIAKCNTSLRQPDVVQKSESVKSCFAMDHLPLLEVEFEENEQETHSNSKLSDSNPSFNYRNGNCDGCSSKSKSVAGHEVSDIIECEATRGEEAQVKNLAEIVSAHNIHGVVEPSPTSDNMTIDFGSNSGSRSVVDRNSRLSNVFTLSPTHDYDTVIDTGRPPQDLNAVGVDTNSDPGRVSSVDNDSNGGANENVHINTVCPDNQRGIASVDINIIGVASGDG